MITLDEAIKHAEDVAEENEHDAKEYNRLAKLETFPSRKEYESAYKRCCKCAEEHRQLAAWLRDYKRLLAIAAGVDVKCGNCRWDGVKGVRCYSCYQYSNWEEANSA